MGLFDGLGDAKASLDSNWIKPGNYLLLIQQLKTGETRKKEAFLCLEGRVVHVFDDADGIGHRVGEDVSHMLMAKHESFLGNVKAMIKGILDCDLTDITEEMAEALCEEDQPLAGLVVEIISRNIETRKGGDFTKVSYTRTWLAEELEKTLSPLVINRYFDNGDDLLLMKQREEQVAAEMAQ